jgi:2-keto-4-pentenoate hydratase/2-oxohepta-3-ene-1,7-dioic acid hydratase in catechol pathway
MAVRLANAGGRAVVVLGDQIADVERASAGRFGSDPMQALARWDDFASWAAGLAAGAASRALNASELGPPVPRPSKVFAIGLNYKNHAAEAGLPLPAQPMVFTKFPNCLVGPRADVQLSSGYVDWEIEVVAVIGRGGKHIAAAQALTHLAGVMVGQDISDRKLQFRDQPAQFSLAKSIDTFGPTGPALVSLDGVPDPDDLHLTCDVAGERMQDARSSDMVFPLAELVAYLSRHCTLTAGDMIFTGTPAGVGSTRNPRRYLAAGEEIVSTIEGIGTLRNRCVAQQRCEGTT